jgi:hypothetical protein
MVFSYEINKISKIVFIGDLKIIRMGRDEGLSAPNESRLQQISIEAIVEQILNQGLSIEIACTSLNYFFPSDSFPLRRDRAKQAKELKQHMMEGADIVVCTLNYSGNTQFDPFSVTQQGQRSSFDCLIVDEASQCLELDVFIPLRLGIRRVLLVGDPEQLPPTVLSNNALNAKFGQSLMERLYSLFQSNDLIRMLNIVSVTAWKDCNTFILY